ncbi:MAG TPA: excinuclease ABC subunit UvrC, partial [Micrococcaceae bacterium]
LEAAVQVFHVRGGRIRGQRGWVVEKVEDSTPAELVEHLLQQVYGEGGEANDGIPRQILVPELPSNDAELTEWLCGLRGAKVEIRVPQRGDKAALLDTVRQNAEQAMKLHKSRRAGDLTARSLALQELQEALDLPVPLLRIECFDISHVQGTNVVASMVVVEDGLSKKSEYRKFAITGDAAVDDTASMYDVISRRFRNYLQEQAGRAVFPESGEITDQAPAKPKFAYPPNLVVVDGGQPQVAAASRALVDLGIDDVYVVGLAKRLEEVWLPGSDFPVILPRTSQGLYLLQRIRDEAHRFAITFHRQKRAKSMTASLLDEVPGMGEAKRKTLLAHFGSVKKVRGASAAEIAQLKGFGPVLAAAVHDALHRDGAEEAAPAVNMSTGEILES